MHILIISGGYLNLPFAKEYCKTLSADKVFVVDKGLQYADTLQILPDVILGDFDTVDKSLLFRYEERILAGELKACIERYPAKKDASDTELALMKAIEMEADEVTILAGTGSRLDHVLMNMELLLMAERAAVNCYIVDETNRIQMLSDEARTEVIIQRKKQHGKYLSVIPLSPVVKGLTMSGVAYPLKDKEILLGNTLTVSNRITEPAAIISLKQGSIWVIESKDKGNKKYHYL